MHHLILEQLTCHQTLQPARKTQMTTSRCLPPTSQQREKSKRGNRSDERLRCLPAAPQCKNPSVSSGGRIFASLFCPKKKNGRLEKKKKDHTTSSGKGPFSGPLVCRLLSRPNRVPPYPHFPCVVHDACAEAIPIPPSPWRSKWPRSLPVGDNSPQRRNLLGLLKKLASDPFDWDSGNVSDRPLPPPHGPVNPPVQRRGGWEQNPASHV